MTEKLYYYDSFILKSDATVIDIIEDGGDTFIILDKTPFFPLGGGQPCDTGYINNVFINFVEEKDGIIYHRTSDNSHSLLINDQVTCNVNSEDRLERMRAHSGEHVISGIAHNEFGVENVGFHMDEENIITIDFDKYLTSEQILFLEKKANDCVFDDLPISAKIYTNKEASSIQFRSKMEFLNDVRIVEIEGIDKCACCAPHLTSTSQIGIIKILSCISHRGGCRLTAICGKKALNDYIDKSRQILNISALLCAKHSEVDTAVELLQANVTDLRQKFNVLMTEYLTYVAKSIKTERIIFDVFDNFSVDDLRIIANSLSNSSDIVILLSGDDMYGYSYCICSDKIDICEFAKDFNKTLNGRGGGRGNIIQGKINSNIKTISSYINEIEVDKYANA